MPINPSSKKMYESFEMIHPDGYFMSFVSEKRAYWYINRGLAFWSGDKKFQLKFSPNGSGKGHIPFYTQKLENKCVVCGAEHNLNKHHVVPYVFRSKMPVQYKEKSNHDVLAICVDCHESYEKIAMDFKNQLVKDAGFNLSNRLTEEEKWNKDILSARKMLEKIKNKEVDESLIPKEKVDKFKELSKLELKTVPEKPFWGDLLMNKVIQENKIFDFVKMWRTHFIENMNPQFMPKYWDVNLPLEEN